MLSIVVSRRSGISSGFGGSAAGTDRPMWALRLKSVISDDMRVRNDTLRRTRPTVAKGNRGCSLPKIPIKVQKTLIGRA